jgi:cell division septal protein FtsQ
MTFDQFVDAVDAQIHGRLGTSVRTAELSWDSAVWVGSNGTAIAEAADDNNDAVRLTFDNGETVSVSTNQPEVAGAKIAERLVGARA